MKEKTNIPDVFQESYDLWHKKYIEEKKEWVLEVNKNPFIAIESHINEDTITDLLAHILQTNMEIKKEFITFLLNKAKKDKREIESIKKIIDKNEGNTEIETQYSIKGESSRLDLLIIVNKKYYFIIENKIFDAPEQPKQMERYIEGIINTFKPKPDIENVIAFYATPDGQGECQTSGEYSVTPLAFYSDDPEEKTIYYVLLDATNGLPSQGVTPDFCFYLKYRFNNPQSVSFLQNLKNKCGIDLCIEDCLEELFNVNGKYPSISKNINAYTDPENYFYQLLKVHTLNCYLLNKFLDDNRSYHGVFDGIRIKRQAKIGGSDCNVYFETKYEKNYFFMVITISSLNIIYNKIMKLLKNRFSDCLYIEQNEFNKENSYSLWLWIQDPSVLKKNKKKIEDLKNLDDGYMAYIDYIFIKCMKKIFDGLSLNQKINQEELDIYLNYYDNFQQ